MPIDPVGLDVDDFFRLRTNAGFLILEFRRRGVPCRVLDAELNAFSAIFQGREERFLHVDASRTAAVSALYSAHKSLARRLLNAAGLRVADGILTTCEQMALAKERIDALGFPLVVKPDYGDSGEGVFCNLINQRDFSQAILTLRGLYGPHERLVVERYMPWQDCRVFVDTQGHWCAVRRDAPQVTGNGKDTLRELAKQETKRRLSPRRSSSGMIVLDEEVNRWLGQQGRTLEFVPVAGEVVLLRGATNTSVGGTCEDITDTVHPSLVDIARRALAVFEGVPYAGIDILAEDVTAPQTSASYCVLEVNAGPGIGIHIAPEKGAGRNVAAAIIDCVMPATRPATAPGYGPDGQVPMVDWPLPATREDVAHFFARYPL